MSAHIKYAYLKGRTWLYRRNYPGDVALALGSRALKRSLKTGDTATARIRAAEINARYETLVQEVRSRSDEVLRRDATEATSVPEWGSHPEALLLRLRGALEHSDVLRDRRSFSRPVRRVVPTVRELSRVYLGLRSNELRPGGFKSVRYSVGLFVSRYGAVQLDHLSREQGREFLGLIAQLSPLLGKSEKTRGLSLDRSVAHSRRTASRITVRTRKRIWSQVNHFLTWTIHEGHLEQHPFRSVRFEGRVKPAPYAVPSDREVATLLRSRDRAIHEVLLFCLLSGMRAGEAVGLLREDLVSKGNLGTFVHVRPNAIRLLKTEAAERLVPLHPVLRDRLERFPATDRLFPDLTVNEVTKGFAKLRRRLGLERPGLVFHSTRKWFITRCERTGVPEHFTASLVGHKSARSENGITYGIYSAGISDEQRRGIVDQIRLPEGCAP